MRTWAPYSRRRSSLAAFPTTSFEYAPAVKNLIGDTHAMGGHRLGIALSYSF